MPGEYSTDLAFVDAQVDEMTKIAIGAAGMGRLIGAGLGTGIGGTVGYARAAPDQKLQGAVKGGVIGGLAGLAGGQVATKAGQKQVVQFGQRQLHGATGYLPGRGIWGTKGPALKPAGRVAALEQIGWKVPKKVDTTGVGKITPTEGAIDKAIAAKGEANFLTKHLRGGRIERAATKAKLRSQAARGLLAEEGLTSLPGLAKGYAFGTKDPVTGARRLSRAGVLKANLLAPGVAMGVGLPAAFAAPGVVESVQQRDIRPAARNLVEGAGYAIGGGLPMAMTMGLGTGVSAAAGRLLGSPKQPQQPQQLPVTRYQRAAQQYGAPLGQVVR